MIAIDGPVAAGKTVVAHSLAHRLGYKCLDTGVMYRAITWLSLQIGISVDDESALGALAEANPVTLEGESSDEVRVGGHLLGPELRDSQVTGLVSLVSRISAVRSALVRQQRMIGAQGDIIMVGRDIGTVVLPDADLKVFLNASPEVRARRRWQQMRDQGQTANLQQVLQETLARDELDTHRADSPLVPAADALLVDTDNTSAEQVVELMLDHINGLSQENSP